MPIRNRNTGFFGTLGTGIKLGIPADPTALNSPGEAFEEGQLYYDTTNNVMRVYNGTNWVNLTTGGAVEDFHGVSDLTAIGTGDTAFGAINGTQCMLTLDAGAEPADNDGCVTTFRIPSYLNNAATVQARIYFIRGGLVDAGDYSLNLEVTGCTYGTDSVPGTALLTEVLTPAIGAANTTQVLTGTAIAAGTTTAADLIQVIVSYDATAGALAAGESFGIAGVSLLYTLNSVSA